MKNILIINAHPDKKSFCFALAESYKMGAVKTNSNVKLVHLVDLKFNPILTYGYRTLLCWVHQRTLRRILTLVMVI